MILNNTRQTATRKMAAATLNPPSGRQLSSTPVLVPLSSLAQGEGRVVRVEADSADAARLMALGVCVGRRVQVVKAGDPLIVRVVGARVGLSARLAAAVLVATGEASRNTTTAA